MKYFNSIMFSVACMILAGCGFQGELVIDKPAAEVVETRPEESTMVIDQTSPKMQKRFDPTITGSEDSGQKEFQWAHRYEELSIKNNALRETNNELTLENNRLKQQIEIMQNELKQAKKDITEANEFLGQMHLELNKWKEDVLGNRQQIREAQQVQIEALTKILRLLGAEPDYAEEGSSDTGESK